MCKNEKGYIFGGYSSISWISDNKGKYKPSEGSFLFTLTNIDGTQPTKYPNSQNKDSAVYHKLNYGPTFGNGHDLFISDNYLNNCSSYCYLGYAYPDILGYGKSIFTGDGSNNDMNFKMKELEVFKLK